MEVYFEKPKTVQSLMQDVRLDHATVSHEEKHERLSKQKLAGRTQISAMNNTVIRFI